MDNFPCRLSTCLLLLPMIAHGAFADEALQPMFNGQDLSGWVLTNTPPETWTWQDGLLVCSGQPIGEIRTQKMYQNFVMELEWRHMVPRGNAGIFVWADDITARGVPFHRGIEVQVLENAYGNSQNHTTHGDIFPIHGATMTPVNGRGGSRAFPTESLSKPSPQWNHYRIECRDGDISLAVNGTVVTRGKNCVPRRGYICLESEGGIVHYRNVRIQELPSTELQPDQSAISDRGYRSLYTGLNLNGWKVPASDTHWQSQDWVLAYSGGSNDSSRLSSTETFENMGFLADVRLKADASNVVIEVGPGLQIDLREERFAKHLEPTGRWNRLEGGCFNGTCRLAINGHYISYPAGPKTSGTGSLSLMPTGPVDFCNIYGRTLTE